MPLKTIIAILLAILFFGCKPQLKKNDVIIIRGSDTMVNLTRLWAESYIKLNPGVSVQINGGGSGIGIASLLNGTGSIATISRELKESEIQNAKKLNINPKKYVVALDAIAIVVNNQNPLDKLTFNQLRDVFSGKIKNWKYFGGIDKEINLYGRENSSGTYEFMKEYVLKDKLNNISYDFAPSTQVLQGTATLSESIANDKYGIGYGSLGYFAKKKDIKILLIQADSSVSSVNLIENNIINYPAIWSGKYPLSRSLFFYTNGKPNKAILEFIKFVSSNLGQELVKKMEYVPLPVLTDENGKR